MVMSVKLLAWDTLEVQGGAKESKGESDVRGKKEEERGLKVPGSTDLVDEPNKLNKSEPNVLDVDADENDSTEQVGIHSSAQFC